MGLNQYVKDVGYPVTPAPTQDYSYLTPNGSECLGFPKRVKPLTNNASILLSKEEKQLIAHVL
jgi:hypothetical protein